MYPFLAGIFPYQLRRLVKRLCIGIVFAIGATVVHADTAIDGTYLSDSPYYSDALQGNIAVGTSVKLELEFRIQHGKMAFMRIQAPFLEGIDSLYSRVHGLGCVYTSLGYPVMYPGSDITVKTKHEKFDIQYQSNGKNIFNDSFVVTNLKDAKTQTYQWKVREGRLWFDDAPFKYDPAAKTYSFQVNPQFLPENYGHKYRQQGVLGWFSEVKLSFSQGQGEGTLILSCPPLPIKFKLKKLNPNK